MLARAIAHGHDVGVSAVNRTCIGGQMGIGDVNVVDASS